MTSYPGHAAIASLCWFSSKPSLLCKAHVTSVCPQEGELFSSYREPLSSLKRATVAAQIPL